jgi:hypothetical protein
MNLSRQLRSRNHQPPNRNHLFLSRSHPHQSRNHLLPNQTSRLQSLNHPLLNPSHPLQSPNRPLRNRSRLLQNQTNQLLNRSHRRQRKWNHHLRNQSLRVRNLTPNRSHLATSHWKQRIRPRNLLQMYRPADVPEVRRRRMLSTGVCQCVDSMSACSEQIDLRSPPFSNAPSEVSGISPTTTIALAAGGGGLGLLSLLIVAIVLVRWRSQNPSPPRDDSAATLQPRSSVLGSEYGCVGNAVDAKGRTVIVSAEYSERVVSEDQRASNSNSDYSSLRLSDRRVEDKFSTSVKLS